MGLILWRSRNSAKEPPWTLGWMGLRRSLFNWDFRHKFHPRQSARLAGMLCDRGVVSLSTHSFRLSMIPCGIVSRRLISYVAFFAQNVSFQAQDWQGTLSSKGFLHSSVQVGVTCVHLFAIHLCSREADVRTAQIQELLQAVRPVVADHHVIVSGVTCSISPPHFPEGDFNICPQPIWNSTEYPNLLKARILLPPVRDFFPHKLFCVGKMPPSDWECGTGDGQCGAGVLLGGT